MKITKSTKLALVGPKNQITEVLAEGREAVEQLLTPRAEPKFGMEASHVRRSTRKYQCNAALAFAKPIAKLRKEHGLKTEGKAIRLVLEAGLKALGFEELVEEVEREVGEETES